MHAGYHIKYIYIYISLKPILHSSNRTTERIVVSIHVFFFSSTSSFLSFFQRVHPALIKEVGLFMHKYIYTCTLVDGKTFSRSDVWITAAIP